MVNCTCPRCHRTHEQTERKARSMDYRVLCSICKQEEIEWAKDRERRYIAFTVFMFNLLRQ